ncbi:MAG: hypothetical protein WAX89_04125, partial [Alphaproteobacteria bacterium]
HSGVTLRALALNIGLLTVAGIGYMTHAGATTLLVGLAMMASSAYRIRILEQENEDDQPQRDAKSS